MSISSISSGATSRGIDPHSIRKSQKFLPPDLDYLSHHIAAASERLRVRYKGAIRKVQYEIHVWESGKKTLINKTVVMLPTDLDSNITVTVHDIDEFSSTLMYKVVLNAHGNVVTCYLPKSECVVIVSRSIPLRCPSQLAPGESKGIWAYVRQGRAQLTREEIESPVEEQVRMAEWAVTISAKVLGTDINK